MDRHIPHDYTASNVLAWTATQSANAEPLAEEDASADVDEPPDCRSPHSPRFSRAPIRRGSEQHESLLTKALQSHSENEGPVQRPGRRRSITSNFSLSSGDLTCDTGLTTPARTSSPSPKLPNVGFVPITTVGKRVVVAPQPGPAVNVLAANAQQTRDPAIEVLEKKRCISFACAAKPKADDKMLMPLPPKPTAVTVKLEEAPKKRCIQFACTARVPSPTSALQRGSATPTGRPVSIETSSKPRLSRSPVVRRTSRSPHPAQSKKWLAADPKDLDSECSRFHEFASDEHQEDDWIRRDDTSTRPKITINDTLKKENEFRKIGKEAEEEADQEEEDEDENDLEDDADENDDEDDDDGDDVDAGSDDGSDNDSHDDGSDDDAEEKHLVDRWDDASDGYKTDNEVGFADSDEEDDDLELWTALGQRSFSGATAIHRRSSAGHHSDSSEDSRRIAETIREKRRQKRTAARPPTPELPDSTDFVCGTLDEDRPLEEAYISHLAARKKTKLHLIPQDIDPSFPTSEPEDEGEELYKKGYADSEDQVWLHGELEDIHHDLDRAGRRRKPGTTSPKRLRSPPPKQRRHSPPPKIRGRSPRRHLERQSPTKSPLASVVPDEVDIAFKSLAFRPGLTFTKSLPRGPVMFPHLKTPRRSRASTITREAHVRGAIDIVKGLEQKRQRRREKFYQKCCTRARKELAQGQVKRPLPGQGAQRMREVGLIMAGKVGPGANFVLSI